MRRELIPAVAFMALVVASVSTLSCRREDTTSQRQAVNSEVRLSKLENRLAQLEGRLNHAVSNMGGSPARTAPSEGTESPEETEEGTSELLSELAKLRSLTNDLFSRIKALEEDPVNRGYTFISSENPDLRLMGIGELRRLAKSDPATRAAIRNLLQDPSERVRREAADALGDLGDEESAALMAQLLSDPDAGVRWEAIDSFADWGHREAAPLITQMLKDPEANVRREAIVALGTLRAGEAGAEIAQLLSDSSEQVRREAADVLGRLRAREGTTALLRALSDSNENVRGEAIASLGEVGAVEAIPYLREIYENNPGRNLVRVVGALRTLGDEQPFRQEVDRLSQVALSGDDGRARGRAVQMLSWFARDEAREVFTRLLKDPDGGVRREAERALRRR